MARVKAQHDVLVISGGLVPQLVTETLYGLHVEATARGARDSFWPAQVIVAGTERTRRNFEDGRLNAQLQGLCQTLRQPTPAWRVETLSGVEDIRTADEADRFGSLIATLVQEITGSPTTRLHVSLAGGRKTMTFHAGAALSIYGRLKDRLSHTLVRPVQAESATNFWHPTVDDLMLTDAQGRPVEDAQGHQINAKDVHVDLANITYFSVRDRLPKMVIGRPMAYEDLAKMVGMALGERPIVLTIKPSTKEVVIPGLEPLSLPPQEFALYQLLSELARDGSGGAGPFGVGGNHTGWITQSRLVRPQEAAPNLVERYFWIYRSLRGPGSQKEAGPKRVHTDTRNRYELETENTEHFGPLRSRLKAKLDAWVPQADVRRRLLSVEEDADGVRFGVDLAPVDILIEGHDGLKKQA